MPFIKKMLKSEALIWSRGFSKQKKTWLKDMDYDRVDKEYCARCGAELTESESYLCDFCRYDEMTS